MGQHGGRGYHRSPLKKGRFSSLPLRPEAAPGVYMCWGVGKQPVVLLCMSSSPCHWACWALEMSRHGGNVVSPFLARCRFTCSRGAGFQGPYACLCVSVGLDSDCSALFQWGLCFCIPLCAVLSVSPPLRVSGLKNLVLSWVTWLPFFFSVQGIWTSWLLSAYMCLCLHAVCIVVSGFGS